MRKPIDREPRISRRQRRFHVVTEALSVAVQVPFFAWLASNDELPPWARAIAAGLAAAVILIDGGLLVTWAATGLGRRGLFG